MIDNELLKFRVDQVLDLEKELVNLNDNNHCVVNYSTFVNTYLPELHALVTNSQYEARRWVGLTGNMFARLTVVADDNSAVIYNIPSVLGQGYTASPDPEDNSLNDRVVYASNTMDTLPDIAITTRHRLYTHMATKLEENNYEETRRNAAKTVALLNEIFEKHGLSTIEVPIGLEDGAEIESKEKSVKKNAVEENVGIDLDDCEML